MLILVPILVYLVAAIALVILHFWRPRPGIAWSIAAVTSLLVWSIVLALRLFIPNSITLGAASSLVSFSFLSTFILDKVSWPFSWALSASLLAWIFTSITEWTQNSSIQKSWWLWPAGLFFGSICLEGVMAGNLNTLIFTWAAMDLFFLFIFLIPNPSNQAVLYAFGTRAIGLFTAIGAAYTALGGTPLSFPLINVQANTFLFIGAFIRLFSVVFSSYIASPSSQRNDLLIVSEISLITTSLVVFSRSTSIGYITAFVPFMTLLAVIMAVTGGFFFTGSNLEIRKRLYWYVALVGIVTVAAVKLLTEASIAWGLALILSGSLLIFHRKKILDYYFLFVMGLIGFSALPFTPAWQGIQIFPEIGNLFQSGFLWVPVQIGFSLLISGYFITIYTPRPMIEGAERWNRIVYPIGLFFLPFTQIVILLIGQPGLLNDLQAFPQLTYLWVNLLIAIVSFFLIVSILRFPGLTNWLTRLQNQISVFSLIRNLLTFLQMVIQRIVHLFDMLFEGEGGILWTILFLLLLLALLSQLNIGV